MEKLNKQIIIGLSDDDQCAISISPDMDAATAMQLIGTLSLHVLNAYKTVATHAITNSDSKEQIKLKKKEIEAATVGITESLYDAMDNVFSTVLAQFYPHHPRYTIEDEAILELVNKKIEDKYNALTPEQKSAYSQAYSKMKLQAEFRKDHMKRGDTNTETTPGA